MCLNEKLSVYKKCKLTKIIVNIIDICKNVSKFWNVGLQEERCEYSNIF